MGRVMSTAVNIGRRIARERRRRGVTQEALAAHLGVSKAAVSKWELGQSLPDVSLLPRIAAYFSLTLDELFDWHDELTAEESAALYAEVYALAKRDLPAARERLRAIAAEHYSDASLLLMLASLLTLWAAGTATPLAPAGEKGDANGAPSDAADLTDEALTALARAVDVAGSMLTSPDTPGSPLWDCVAERLNPTRAGEAWAERKTRQADGVRKALQQEAEERTTSPEWRELAIDDPRYQEIVATAERLSDKKT